MQSGNAAFQKFFALAGGVLNPELGNSFIIFAEFIEAR